jgi:hypothetical protein
MYEPGKFSKAAIREHHATAKVKHETVGWKMSALLEEDGAIYRLKRGHPRRDSGIPIQQPRPYRPPLPFSFCSAWAHHA